MDTKKWCSGLEQLGDGQTRCKHGHVGPGMQACKGIRYPHGTSLAPCEREDLPFCENRKCVRADMRPNTEVEISLHDFRLIARAVEQAHGIRSEE